VSWWGASVAAVITLLVFWVPGGLLLALVRVRGLMLASLAPLVTTFVLGSGAVVVGLLGLRWNALSAVGCLAAAVAVLWLVRARATRDVSPAFEPGARRASWPVVAAVTAGVLSVLVPFGIGMQSPDRTMSGWDALFHLNALEFIRETGRASPLQIRDLYGSGSGGVYPAGWHAIAALVPVWPSRGVVFTMAAYVPLAAAWALGLAFLARCLFPELRPVAVLAPLLASTGAMPVYAMSTMGIVANAWALSMTPACAGVLVLAWRRRRGREWILAIVCIAGLGLAHPGPVLALAVAGLPGAVPVALVWIARTGRTALGRARLCVGLVVTAGGVALAARSATLRLVLGMVGQTTSSWPWNLVDLLDGRSGVAVAGGALVTVAAVTGAALLWRARRRAFVLGCGLLAALPILADPRVPLSMLLIRAWYSEVPRLAPVTWSFVVVLAAYGVVEGTRSLLESGRLTAGPHPERTVRIIAGAVVLIVVVPTVTAVIPFAATALSNEKAVSAPYFTAGELAMVHRLPGELDPAAAVLGSGDSGASHLYGLIGQRVAVPVQGSRPSEALRYIGSHLDRLGSDSRLCQQLAAEGIRYLYVDPEPVVDSRAPSNITTVPPAGVRLIDHGGAVSVYEITGCPQAFG
jgi:hypothetical protein